MKIAYKTFLRNKYYTFVSLFCISLTLTVLLVAGALFNSFFRPAGAESTSDRYLGVYSVMLRSSHAPQDTLWQGRPGYKLLKDTVGRMETPLRVSIYGNTEKMTSFHDGVSVTSRLKRTDSNYWEILNFSFLEGGPFTQRDEEQGNRVAVINETMKMKFFGNAPAVGETIDAGREQYRVVGVVKDVPFFQVAAFADIWAPISTFRSSDYKREIRMGGGGLGFGALLLAKSKKDFARMKDEFQGLLAQLDFPDPDSADTAIAGADTKFESLVRILIHMGDDLEPAKRAFSLGIAIMALMFMSLPAVNLVNINLSRMMERSSEIGIRKAFGASSRALVGQFLVENIVVTAIGGTLSLPMTYWILGALEASGTVPYAEFKLDYMVLGYGVLLVLFFGVISGVYPAWKMSRLHPVDALRGHI